MRRMVKAIITAFLCGAMVISTLSPVGAEIGAKSLYYAYQFDFEANPVYSGWLLESDNSDNEWTWTTYTQNAHGGSSYMSSSLSGYFTDNNPTRYKADNYLISPMIRCPDNPYVEFYAKSFEGSSKYGEEIEVYVGYSTDRTKMTKVNENKIEYKSGSYGKVIVPIPKYIGEDIYIAIKHCGGYMNLLLDDFAVVSDADYYVYEKEEKDICEVFSDDFERNPFDNGWTDVDKDGDGYTWNYSEKYKPLVEPSINGHYKEGAVYSESYKDLPEDYDYPLHPDNYLFSPKISLSKMDSSYKPYLEFFVNAKSKLYSKEVFAVYVGTTKNINDMTLISDEKVLIRYGWTKYKFSLEKFAGKDIYVAIRHYNVSNEYAIIVDDFRVYGASKNLGNYRVDLTDDSANAPKVDEIIKDKKYIYKVTKTGSTDNTVIGELKVIGLKKKSLKQIKIAAKVKMGGITYKVTSIGKNSFKGNKKITKAIIGKNVVNIEDGAFSNCKKLIQVSCNSTVLKIIGKKAFSKDKKLKKIVIKSAKLKSIGKDALKGTHRKLVCKVPKTKNKAYKKLLKKAGNKKVRIK